MTQPLACDPSPQDHHGRGRRRFAVLAGALAALTAVVAVPASASANSDPHRTFLPSPETPLTGYCAFPVTLDFIDNEYGTTTTLPDGSVILKVTGKLFVTVTNDVNGRSVQVNASGPGTITFAPDGASAVWDVDGQLLLPGTNLTDLGFPSNLVLNSGPLEYTQQSGFGQVSGLSGHIHVLTDVCAAVS